MSSIHNGSCNAESLMNFEKQVGTHIVLELKEILSWWMEFLNISTSFQRDMEWKRKVFMFKKIYK